MKDKLIALQAEIRTLIEARGFKVDASKSRYDDSSFSLSIRAIVAGVTEDSTESAKVFKTYCSMYGIPKTAFGVPFNDGVLRGLRIVGLNTRARKNCVQLKRFDGKPFVCTSETVKAAIRKGFCPGVSELVKL